MRILERVSEPGEESVVVEFEDLVEGGAEWYLFLPGAAFPSYQMTPAVDGRPARIVELEAGSVEVLPVAMRWSGVWTFPLPPLTDASGEHFMCADYEGLRCFRL